MFNFHQSVDYLAALVAAFGGNAVDAAATRWAQYSTRTVTRAGFVFTSPSAGCRLLSEVDHCKLASYLAAIEFPLDAVTVHHVDRLSA